MFKITDGKGFQMTFANGWTVSVQFGPGNYCDNRDMNPRFGESFDRAERDAGKQGSATAEIAAWDKNNKWFEFPDGENVMGWVTPDDVVKFIEEIANR
jgi:hypothetical protein